MARTTTRRPTRQTSPRGRFARAGQPARRRASQQQRSRAPAGPLGQITRFAPSLLGKLTGRSGRGRGGLPVNAKMLTGLLGAGAAGTAVVRKRRSRRRDAAVEARAPSE